MKLNDFATMSARDRSAYFLIASQQIGLPSYVLEKDFWVCWLLQRFFSLDAAVGVVTFKGGTSLSKCFGIIDRFSEDIDLGIERANLGYDNDEYFYNAPSGAERERRVNELKKTGSDHFSAEIMPRIEADTARLLQSEVWSYVTDETEPQRVTFNYPRTQLERGYVSPAVLIEFGFLDAWPSRQREIKPYIVAMRELQDLEAVQVRVLDPVRTFWEKATILHQFAHLPAGRSFRGDRQSRHYYDLVRMAQGEIAEQALSQSNLLVAVAQYKKTFYYSAAAMYDLAMDYKTLSLLPPTHAVDQIRRDYEAMLDEMMFPDRAAPSWDEVIASLVALERKIRGTTM